MSFFNFCKIQSAILAIVGAAFLVPVAVAIACAEYSVIPSFLIPMIGAWILFFIFFITGRNKPIKLTTRSSFVIAGFAWVFSSALSALPFLLSGLFPSVTDSFFESVSGFTTTGCTILNDIEALPRSINLWRCETHWLGGMGIVALTVALFPLLGVGGFQLIKAETTGPEKGKVTPKITTTAKVLWLIYAGATVLETILLKIAGMDFIDALSHAFSTLGTGGFSTRNASIGAYNSATIDWIITFFMFFAGVNFSLYFYLFTGKLKEVWQNSEFKAYIKICILASLVVAVAITPAMGSFTQALRYGAFQVGAIISTTGYGTSDYTTWVPAAQFVMFLLFFIGGSSGSTAGGVKVVRWVIFRKQAKNEILKMLHPHGVFSIRLDEKAGRKDIVFSVAAFFICYSVMVMVTTFAGTLANLDILTAFTGALSMVGNVGPAFGQLGPSFNYAGLPVLLKWWYMFVMIAGRLEIYTMIMFLVPDFWKGRG
ncbi:MAG: TrkH family potassium uptake protein [Treponema sp.]|nr:TrkH family potassium uptake protein [Treponema sp.]